MNLLHRPSQRNRLSGCFRGPTVALDRICRLVARGSRRRISLQQRHSETIQADVTISSDQPAVSLAALGWSAFYSEQLEPGEAWLVPMRIATVHRDRVTAVSELGAVRLNLTAHSDTTDIAVGDWVLVAPETRLLVRRLNRRMLLQRRTEGRRPKQLIAANIDTLLIVTSCNDDFNPARLERYLALANEAGATPVIVLTKIDQTADAAPYLRQAEALQLGLDVVVLNAKAPEAALTLAPWCGPGQTVALVGSSGVGKSTLLNALSMKAAEDAQPTGSHSRGRCQGAPHNDVAFAPFNCRWRLGDRHARDANAACQRRHRRAQYSVRGDCRPRVSVSLPGLHP
jgi:hypothetical protein